MANHHSRTSAQSSGGNSADHLGRLWTIVCTLETLHAALDDDAADAEVPTRNMVSMLHEMAESLALDMRAAQDALEVNHA